MRKVLHLLLSLAVCLALTACATKKLSPFQPVDLNAKVKSGEYQKKVDNFHVIFDASSSMYTDHKWVMKFKLAKNTANNLNSTIPDLDLQSGIRLFGPGTFSLKKKSAPLYGITNYTKDGFGKALSSVPTTGGMTPLAKAIDIASDDMSSTKGPLALIIISDAEADQAKVIKSAQSIKSRFGDRICIYPILIGNDPAGRKLMDDIAKAGGCGFATDHTTLSSSQGMANFVERVFLEKAPPRVVPAPVDGDDDGDGVKNSKDRCPGTPKGIKVDKHGCPLPVKEMVTIDLLVEFGFDKHNVKNQYNQHLKEIADFLKSQPNLQVALEGHTDNFGSKAYNANLSKMRANSIKEYLVSNFKIDPARLSVKGYNYSKPKASNDTRIGRQRNRRVQAVITAGQ